MIMKKTFMLLLFFCMMVPAAVHAQQWSDEGELSFVDTGGNSDILTLSIKNLLKYTFNEKTTGSWKVGVLYGKSSGVKNAETYLTEFRVNYLISERLYSSAIAGWLQDEFSGIDPRYYIGPTVGYKFLMGPKQFLIGEAGADYVIEEYTDNTDSSFLRGRAFAQYDYLFTKKNKFVQSLEFLYDFSDSDNYNINSITSFISSLGDNFSLKTSYELKYDNEPVPASLDSTDTILALSLLVNFN